LPRKIQYATAEYVRTIGVTKAAPTNTNVWLAEDDAASHRVALNGTIYGNASKTITDMPTTKRNWPRRNGTAGLVFLGSVVNMPEAMANKPTRQARAIPCEDHFSRMLGWILTA
jgi:hypothetical protein